METGPSRMWWPKAGVAAAALAILACLIATLAIEDHLRSSGRSDLVGAGAAVATLFVVGLLSAAAVGAVLALRRPDNSAGWLFLALALSIALAGVTEAYGAQGAVAEPGSLPGALLAAVISDAIFLVWITLLTLILLVTPTGTLPGPRWRPIAWVSAANGVVFLIAASLRARPLDNPPFEGLEGPFADGPLGEAFNSVALASVIVGHAALLAAIISLIIRARRAQGEERRQLRWLIIPAIPFPFLVAGAWVAAATHNQALLVPFGIGFIIVLPVSAGLAIGKARLYDVDRIVSRAVAYAGLSALVLGSYALLVVAAGVAGGRAAAESVPAAVVATLCAVAVGGLARRKVQDAVDRKFNRRSFDALESVRRFVANPSAGTTIERVLAEASGDSSLHISYWNEARHAWFSSEGAPSPPPAPAAFQMASPGDAPCVAIAFDPAATTRQFVQVLARAARPELENARLRSELALQLAEVRESRARIVAAQLEERRRIEQDLHDGSQQRLLALAMNLRAVQISGDRDQALRALPTAVDEIQTTVRELRELANGLYPGALERGGLSAALRDLAARAPIPIHLSVVDSRFDPLVESSAWFIACEALANVVKHAHASSVSLAAEVESGALILSIEDDGVGGANVAGHGLRGMADRAEVAGGRVLVSERASGGTMVRAVLPCGS